MDGSCEVDEEGTSRCFPKIGDLHTHYNIPFSTFDSI